MKLVICPECSDVVKLVVGKDRFCDCGKSYGKYKDNINAVIGGSAIPIGFANNSLVRAIKNRPKLGNGSTFEAFVIPEECKTITRSCKWQRLNGKAESVR